MLISGKPYKVWKYEKELEKSLVITTLSEGAITITDVDNMSILDRNYYYKVLVDRHNERQQKLKEQQAISHMKK
nr:MAG TPA: hypothetical protein [Caudoviricetes sp.]